MDKAKIIFLDVDGVLNTLINRKIQKQSGNSTVSDKIKIPGDKIFRLKRIVDATGAKIIMSSSWRLGFSNGCPSPAYINLNNQLRNYNIFCEGWTPVEKNRNRGIEIQWWLDSFFNKYGYYPQYVIIDDGRVGILDIHRGHLVRTHETYGLQDIHVTIAINILNS